MSDADSLPVASAVEQLTIAAARVQAVWKRTGVPALDRRQKWDTFLSQSLLPFLRDFCALQEAAEFNAAAENDTLLREVCYLATRLDDVPRDANVAVLAALLKRHYRRTPMASPLLAARRVGGHEEEQEKGGTKPSCDTREEGGMDSGDSDSSRPGDASQRGSRELMFLSLPSFTQLVSDAAKAGRDGDDAEWVKSDEESSDGDKETEEEARLNEEEARTCGINGPVSSASTTAAFSPVFSVKAESTACATAAGTGNESTADAAQALRRLMHANTHEGVRQQLQSELVRLQSLADHRLRVLQLLCKQRALLSRCPADQVVLRAAYRAKFLDGHEGVGALERLTATSSSSSSSAALRSSANANVNNSVDTSTAAARQAAEKEVGEFLRTAEKTNASCGPDGALFTAVDTASAVRNAAAATAAVGATRKTVSVSPPTSSHFVSFPPSPKSSANSTNAPSSVGGGEDSAMNRVQQQLQQQQKATALQDATKTELELLLSTAPCTVDGVPAYEKRDTCVGDAPPPQQNPQNTANHNNNSSSSSSGCGKCHGEGRGTEASGVSWPTCSATTAGPVTACVSCRPTVLEVDVSSVTAFGTHQDLTLRRIQQESDAIVAAIAAHNRRMQAEAADELKALETLDVLWRAMSAQRKSPATSTQLGSGGSSSTKTSGGGGNADGVAIPPGTLLMQPVPFAETMADVLTRYRQLCDAFSADVAAERTAAGSLAGGALALPHSGTHHPSSSSPSSAASSVRPTHASGGDSASPAASLRPSSTSKGSFYIPPCVRHVLRAASFAPVLDYVHRTRVAFQQHLSTQQDRLVDKVMQRLREVYATYYAATRDGAYAVAPDGDLRVAVEEEMLESLQTITSSSSASGGVDSAEAVVDGATGPFSGTTRTTAAQADKVLVSFQRHLTACQQVREQAADEIEFLQLRLHIIQQAEPLVRDYHDIVREEADMHATSRERLLSKKVNMAKQLLQEEKVRRRVAKELPRIVAQLTELLAAWDALQSAVDPRQDSAPAKEAAELCIHGQRVRDLLAAAAARARPRSAVSRSVSPAPPSLARPRVEGAHAVTSHGMTSSAQRRATPSPTPSTPKPPSAQHLRHHTTTTTAAVSPSQLSQRTPRTPPLQRTLSRSPSFATAEVTNRKRPASSARSVSPSVAAKTPSYAFAQPGQRTQQQQQHRGPPTPPLVPSVGLSTRVRSASPAQRSGLSQRPANTPDVRGKATPSGATTPSVPFSTFTRPHH